MNLPMDIHEREGHFGPETGTNRMLDISNLYQHQILTSPPA